MKQLLILTIFTLSFLFAQDELSYEESSVFGQIVKENNKESKTFDIQNIQNVDEDEISKKEEDSLNLTLEQTKNEEDEVELTQEELDAIARKEFNDRYFKPVEYESFGEQVKNIYPNFKNFPKTIYENQRFSVDMELLITTKDFTKIETRFLNSKDISIINPQREWEEIGDNRYKNSYFFKAHSKNIRIPTFQIILYKDDVVVETILLEPEEFNYIQITLNDEYFSNVIARDLKVVSTQTRQYNNNELFTVMQLDAVEGNLEEFRLKGYKEEFFMSLEDSYPVQKLEYNVVIPIHTKELKFTYFNVNTNSFKNIIVPIKLEEALISTQTDLNPNDSNIEFYKKITLGIVTVIILILYILRRNNFYIIIAIILSIIFFMYVKPNDALIIEKDTNIYILPTNNSTVFYKTSTKQIVEVLERKGKFSKILFTMGEHKNKNVGWIKEVNIVED